MGRRPARPQGLHRTLEEIVEEIIAGKQPVDLSAETLSKRTDLPLDWAAQKALLGFD